jgi:hypothetical protein
LFDKNLLYLPTHVYRHGLLEVHEDDTATIIYDDHLYPFVGSAFRKGVTPFRNEYGTWLEILVPWDFYLVVTMRPGDGTVDLCISQEGVELEPFKESMFRRSIGLTFADKDGARTMLVDQVHEERLMDALKQIALLGVITESPDYVPLVWTAEREYDEALGEFSEEQLLVSNFMLEPQRLG